MTKGNGSQGAQQRRLRSQLWFDNPDNPGMTALYLERYLNYGLTRAELTSGKPIIGIAQTGSDLRPATAIISNSPSASARGIRDAGGIAFEFPVHPDPGDRQAADRGARPQPRLSRPGRGAVRLSARRRGADHRLRQDRRPPASWRRRRSTCRRSCSPAGRCSTADYKGKRAGSGTVVWQARQDLAAGKIDYKEFIDIVAASAPSIGHCNTMGTASTMNALAEALGMSLPGCAAIPAPYRERGQIAYETGRARGRDRARGSQALRHPHPRGVRERHRRLLGDRRLDQRADPHQRHRAPCRRRAHDRGLGDGRLRRAAARQHAAGRRISRRGILSRRRRAGGDAANCSRPAASTATRSPSTARPWARTSRKRQGRPMPRSSALTTSRCEAKPGFKVLHGNLFDSAIMKTSVISEEFRAALSVNDPKDPNAFEGRAVVFDGPEDYHHRIDDPALGDRRTHASCSCAAPGRSAIRARPRW